MSNNIHGHVGYGLVLNSEGRYVNFEDENQEGEWDEEFFKSLYPEGPLPVELVFHFIAEPSGEFDEPLVVINSDTANAGMELSYDITGSRDGARDLSRFLATLEKNRAHWNEVLADFVSRCKAKGLVLSETEPHPILYLSWDDGIMGR